MSIENEEFEIAPLTPEKVLELIEQAYPNPITPDDLARWVLSFCYVKFMELFWCQQIDRIKIKNI